MTAPAPTAREICPTTSQRWVADGALLLDVREHDEVAEAAFDVPTLLHIPYSEFEARWAEVPRDRDVVVVCRSGARSLKVTYFLMNHGYYRVVNMSHGILRWQAKGFPMRGRVADGTTSSGGCCGSPSAVRATTSSCGGTAESAPSSCC